MSNVEATVTLLLTGSLEHDYTLLVKTCVDKPFRVENAPIIVCTCSTREQAKLLLSILKSSCVAVDVQANVEEELFAGDDDK